jgi:hypothetical protein
MTEPDPIPHADEDEDDPILTAAGARLRGGSRSISPDAVQVAVLRRRSRRAGVLVAASLLVVVALVAALAVERRGSGPASDVASRRPGAPTSASVEQLVASLPPRPIDPTKVRLVSSVSSFGGCDALIGDLRRLGAQHVGSQGFGANGGIVTQGYATTSRQGRAADAAATPAGASTSSASDQATTLGTNVQVAGVDELDSVKSEGKLIYDLDGEGHLRITDATTLVVLSSISVVPKVDGPSDGHVGGPGFRGPAPRGPIGPAQTADLLVSGGRVAIFGSETETSKPVDGDPSATQSTTSFLTVTLVDATDPAAPKVTDRVRVEGSLVSARLVGGQIRLVTTSNLADLGFVMPTTPNSVPKALEQNRRSVASSSVADWIPDWQRKGEAAQPLVPCERVHVPDTFSGVAMTSMVTFPLGTGRFDPAATSILAPATTLYAGTDKVAISSEVWVDPIDRVRLQFKNWQTAIHEFHFADVAAPSYDGSGIVDGSTVGQFAYGEVGDGIGVVTTKGTPWQQDPAATVDLTILAPNGAGGLRLASKVADLSEGKGAVAAVRFIDGRILVSTGFFGQEVDVIDTAKIDQPRRAGTVGATGAVEYFHPLPGQRALLVGSRYDQVGKGLNARQRSWVQAELLDVSNADSPRIVSTWEQPWVSEDVGSDHHAFTYWPGRQLALFGLRAQPVSLAPEPNKAIVLSTDGGVRPVANPVANEPPATAAPCPVVDVTDPTAKQVVGADGVALLCGDTGRVKVEWPRYRCSRVDGALVARFESDRAGNGAFFICSPAPPPAVARVLVVSGRPILFTDQTLEALDPSTFASTAIAYHPTGFSYGGS